MSDNRPKPPPHPAAADNGEVFTVVMPAVVFDRFDRWLRREHLGMTSAGDRVYVVGSPGARQ